MSHATQSDFSRLPTSKRYEQYAWQKLSTIEAIHEAQMHHVYSSLIKSLRGTETLSDEMCRVCGEDVFESTAKQVLCNTHLKGFIEGMEQRAECEVCSLPAEAEGLCAGCGYKRFK